MSAPLTSPASSRVLRAAVWIAIGALIAAALVCVVWVLLGDANGMIGKAFLTIVLLAAFAGIAVGEAHLASRRPAWFALASMVTWVLTLLLGAVFIWLPYEGFGRAVERFAQFLVVVLILQLALLHARLFVKAYERHRTTFTAIVTYATLGLVVILAVMLILPVTLDGYVRFLSFYWRVVVALAILAAVGTALVPLVNALFAPKRPREPRPVTAPYAPQPTWPTYADGRTPLPMLPDGAPDWNAYYTGRPTYPHGFLAPAPAAPAPAPTAPAQAPASAPTAAFPPPTTPPAPGYQGYPPPPPPPA